MAKVTEQGEQTGRQISGTVGGLEVAFPSVKVLPGTYQVYRRMRGNPTIALARAAATAPVRAAQWGIETRDGTPEAWQDFVSENIEPRWPVLIKDMLYGLDYGHASFEKVWRVRPDGLWDIVRVKPLLPEMTEVVVDADTGAFAGLRQEDIVLDVMQSFHFVYDGEAGDFYGRSRHENCRAAWANWDSILAKASVYVQKTSGVIPMIQYPEGKSTDAAGTEVDNYQHAKRMLQELGQAHGVYMPNTLAKFAEDLVRQGVDISQLKAWHISFLEAQSRHGDEFVTMMRHMESLLMRGWLVPERTATEGQHGTLADATAHTSLALVVSDLLLQDITRYINWYLIDPMLAVNFGEDARGAVYVSPETLGSDEKTFFRTLATAVLANPMNVGMLQTMVDLETMLDIAGLPRTGSEGPDLIRQAEDAAKRAESGELEPSVKAALLGIYQHIASGRLGGRRTD